MAEGGPKAHGRTHRSVEISVNEDDLTLLEQQPEGLIKMSDDKWVKPEHVIDHGVEEHVESTEDRNHKLRTGAFTAAGLGLAIFGGITAYKHLRDK